VRPNEIDVVLQRHTPMVMVPLHGEFVAMEEVGHRFLAAKDGLWLEVRRPWLHLIWPLAQQQAVRMPFGTVSRTVDVAFGKIPSECLSEFIADAMASHPNEVGAVVVWNARSGAMEYRARETVAASRGHLRALWPSLDVGEWVVADLHSHGDAEAFFSITDREDTGSEVVVAGVVGRVASGRPQWAFSLFACGLEIPVTPPQDSDMSTPFACEERGG
jgi:PRTRC genetic system protein A